MAIKLCYMRIFICGLIACIFIFSCQKQLTFDGLTSNPGGGGTSHCVLKRMVQGTGIDDTVFLFTYDTLKRIHSIIDSIYKDSSIATYDKLTGNLLQITYSYGEIVKYSYNASKKPVDGTSSGNRVVAEYISDSMLSKVTQYYPDNNVWKVWRYVTFEYDAVKNLKGMKEYTPSNVLTGRIDFTYTNLQNTLGSLNAFNFENYLGTVDILPTSMYLYTGKFLLKSYIVSDLSMSIECAITYKTDNSQKVTTSTAIFKNPVTSVVYNILTRKYFYECK